MPRFILRALRYGNGVFTYPTDLEGEALTSRLSRGSTTREAARTQIVE